MYHQSSGISNWGIPATYTVYIYIYTTFHPIRASLFSCFLLEEGTRPVKTYWPVKSYRCLSQWFNDSTVIKVLDQTRGAHQYWMHLCGDLRSWGLILRDEWLRVLSSCSYFKFKAHIAFCGRRKLNQAPSTQRDSTTSGKGFEPHQGIPVLWLQWLGACFNGCFLGTMGCALVFKKQIRCSY